MVDILSVRSISQEEFFALKPGDRLFVNVGGMVFPVVVTEAPFFNYDSDDPDWEVVTNEGFFDLYSLAKPLEEEKI